MSGWTEIGNLADIPLRGSRVFNSARGEIAIFRTGDDTVFALVNRCPHKNGPLSEGIVHGHKVTCPLHNWVIDLEDGQAVAPDKGCTPTLPVKLIDGRIWIHLAIPLWYAHG